MSELIRIMRTIDATDEPFMIPDFFEDKEKPWDYRRWDLKCMNALFKGEIEWMRDIYEEPFLSGRVDTDEIYLKDIVEASEQVVDFTAQKKWMRISVADRERILRNAFCLNCRPACLKMDIQFETFLMVI